MAFKNNRVVVLVPVGVVAVDLDDLGHEAPAGPPLEVNDDVHRVPDICLDGAVRNFDTALENATRESSQSLTRARRVNGRKAAGVAGIEQLQEIKGLTSANLAEYHSIGPVAKGRLQEVANGDRWKVVFRLPGLKANKIVLCELDFGGVFDKNDAFVRRNKFP